MTLEQAIGFILSQRLPDSGRGEPQTFLGGLRPYRGLLPRACFHDLMAALRVVGPSLASGREIDRDLMGALWTICHLTRIWALVDGSMLRENSLIDPEDLAILERWHDMLSYAVMILLESGDENEAFGGYDRYLEGDAG